MAYRLRRRTRKVAPRRYVRKTRAYRKKRTYRRTRRMGGRARFSRHVHVSGRYYKTNEVIQKGHLSITKVYQNASSSGTTIPALQFDLTDIPRAGKVQNVFEWMRFKRCVLRVKPLQPGSCSELWQNGQSLQNPEASTGPPVVQAGPYEPPNFVSYFDADGGAPAPTTYEQALTRPYSKCHSFFNQNGFARAFKPMIVKSETVSQGTSTALTMEKKVPCPWIPCWKDSKYLEIFGPQLYIPPFKITGPQYIEQQNPMFKVMMSVEVEFKGVRTNPPV